MFVTAKDKSGKCFQFNQPGSSLSAVGILAEEYIKSRADADKLTSLTIVADCWPEIKENEAARVSQIAWNKYPETKPVIIDKKLSSRFLVWRKGCEKLQFETWNNTGWAYNNNDITHWALITPPNK